MKKVLIGVFAVVFAIGAVAFTNASRTNDTVYYFMYNSSGSLVFPSTPPPEELPAVCSGAEEVNCARAYPDRELQGDGLWHPVGTPGDLFKRPAFE